MNGIARTGTVGEERFVVSQQHLIDFAHDKSFRVRWMHTAIMLLYLLVSVGASRLASLTSTVSF